MDGQNYLVDKLVLASKNSHLLYLQKIEFNLSYTIGIGYTEFWLMSSAILRSQQVAV